MNGDTTKKQPQSAGQVCPFPTGLAIDPRSQEMKVIGASQFCFNCLMYNPLANECNFVLLFKQVRSLQSDVDSLKAKAGIR